MVGPTFFFGRPADVAPQFASGRIINSREVARDMPDQLTEFIRTKKGHMLGSDVDWETRKSDWIRSVEELYHRVEELLRSSIEAGDASVTWVETQVTEEFVGTYWIPRLEITIGNEGVVFRPMGLVVVGADGRVDLKGARGTVTLLREKSGEWVTVLERVPERKARPFDSDSLRKALQRVMLPVA